MKRIATPLLGLLLLLACSDGRLVAPHTAPAEVRLDPDAVELYEGESAALLATVLDASGEALPAVPAWATTSWESSDTAVARVVDGTLLARRPGSATLTARIAGLEGSATVQVLPVVESAVPSHPEIDMVETAQLFVSITSRDARGQRVHGLSYLFTSSDPAVVTVDSAGVVTAHQPGAATIAAVLPANGPGGPLSVEIPVEVRVMVASLTISPDSARLTVGDTIQLEIEPRDLRGAPVADARLRVISVSPALVSIDGANRLTALGAGLASLQVSVDDNGPGGNFWRVIPVRINPHQLTSRVTRIEINQGIQRGTGDLPLVAGREGLLRVYLESSSINFFAPRAVAHVGPSGGPLTVVELTGGEGLPVRSEEGVLHSTLNAVLPPELIQQGMEVRVEVQLPSGTPLTEGSELHFPAVGAQPFEIRTAPPIHVHFVPISYGSLPTVIPQGRPAQYVALLEAMFPLAQVEFSMGAPFSSSSPGGGPPNYGIMLNELWVMRMADGITDPNHHYYGLTRVPSGSLGSASLGNPVAVGVSDHYLGDEVFVHELGHNFDRRHAPCGNAPGVDPQYPYPGAVIAHWGYDRRVREMRDPGEADVMSYCTRAWVSDYTYEAVLNWRGGTGAKAAVAPPPAPAAAQRALVLWGRALADGVEVEPAFILDAPPVRPDGTGPYRLEGRDAAGQLLFAFAFEAAEVLHGAPGERIFAFAVPEAAVFADRLAEIRVEGRGVSGVRRGTPGSGVARVDARRLSRDELQLRWNADLHPLVVVRDGEGRVLALARGGEARVRTPATRLHLEASSGTTSAPLEVGEIH